MTQEDMGRALSITPRYVQMIEGGWALPSPRILDKLGEVAGFNHHLLRLFLLRDMVDQFTDEKRQLLGLNGAIS